MKFIHIQMYKIIKTYKMQTRSQTRELSEIVEPTQKTNFTQHLIRPLLPVEIDFDEASNAWKANKKSLGNGCYKYTCIKITKTGKKCKNDSLRGCDKCRFHNK